jgi:hypothetical protein
LTWPGVIIAPSTALKAVMVDRESVVNVAPSTALKAVMLDRESAIRHEAAEPRKVPNLDLFFALGRSRRRKEEVDVIPRWLQGRRGQYAWRGLQPATVAS